MSSAKMTMALVGEQDCGCITAVQIEGYADEREMASFYTDMANTGRKVRRVAFEEVKALPTFLNCTHEPSPENAVGGGSTDG